MQVGTCWYVSSMTLMDGLGSIAARRVMGDMPRLQQATVTSSAEGALAEAHCFFKAHVDARRKLCVYTCMRHPQAGGVFWLGTMPATAEGACSAHLPLVCLVISYAMGMYASAP